MSVKNVSLLALAVTLLGAGMLQAQGPPTYGTITEEIPPPRPGLALEPVAPGSPYGLSNWILYNQPGCCGPLGNQQPLRYELFLRAGPSFPIEGEVFSRTLETGWAIEGGGRLVCFDLPQTKAWTLEMSLTNVHNNGRRSELEVPLFFRELINNPNFNPFQPIGPNNPQQISIQRRGEVMIRALNRTFVNMAAGREWYLVGDGGREGPSWRFGMDIGGSWGSNKAEFVEIRHRTDVVYRCFVALHSDVEIPRGCFTYVAGFRALWDYSWSEVLQSQNNGDLQDIMLMGTIGVRF